MSEARGCSHSGNIQIGVFVLPVIELNDKNEDMILKRTGPPQIV